MTPRERCIRVLLRILRNPYRFTLRELSAYFGHSTIDALKDDIDQLRRAGMHVDIKRFDNYRYAILPDREFKELDYLQPLTENDRAKISRALDYISEKDKLYLSKKLESLYDFQQLGLRALRRPALDRIDKLGSARKQKKQAVLIGYRSNSGSIRNRIVEPFHIDVELDTVQALNVEEDPPVNKHFLLSRIERVKILEERWQFEDLHAYQKTDVFRIANNRQILVQLRLNVYAYNALVGAYPKALSEITPGSEPLTYEFQSMVNEDFIGLTNYILGNAAHARIEIIRPEKLKKKINQLATAIIQKNRP